MQFDDSRVRFFIPEFPHLCGTDAAAILKLFKEIILVFSKGTDTRVWIFNAKLSFEHFSFVQWGIFEPPGSVEYCTRGRGKRGKTSPEPRRRWMCCSRWEWQRGVMSPVSRNVVGLAAETGRARRGRRSSVGPSVVSECSFALRPAHGGCGGCAVSESAAAAHSLPRALLETHYERHLTSLFIMHRRPAIASRPSLCVGTGGSRSLWKGWRTLAYPERGLGGSNPHWIFRILF